MLRAASGRGRTADAIGRAHKRQVDGSYRPCDRFAMKNGVSARPQKHLYFTQPVAAVGPPDVSGHIRQRYGSGDGAL
jgi:hypothetical protein